MLGLVPQVIHAAAPRPYGGLHPHSVLTSQPKRAGMSHFFATGYVRGAAGTYRVACTCGDMFTGTLAECRHQFGVHLDMLEDDNEVELGLSVRDVRRLTKALLDTIDDQGLVDPDDVSLLHYLVARVAQWRKKQAVS